MTTIFDDGSKETRTHAFLIGVGGYTAIDKPHPKLPLDLRKLEALPSASLSTCRVGRWLQEHLDAGAMIPLGSLEILLAEPATKPVYTTEYEEPIGKRHTPDLPTLAMIETAFIAWLDRCDRNPGNLAFFYFCGHGFMKAGTLLLAHDYGTPHTLPFKNAIAFDEFFLGMGACKARRQLFLADCCRQVPATALQNISSTLHASPLIGSTAGALSQPQQLGLYATNPGAKAFTLPDEPTQFTKALLEALGGRGVDPMQGNEWHVTFSGLVKAVSAALAEGTAAGAPYQFPQPLGGGGQVSIHKLKGEPQVPITLSCLPEAAIDAADLAVSSLAGQIIVQRPASLAGSDKLWRVKLRPQQYCASARFSNAALGFKNVDQHIFWAMPPGGFQPLDVS
jgi:hypothetical protein